MIELLVIADDLTGANDTGVQFAKAGVRTLVTTDVEIDSGAAGGEFAVLVVDTETRHVGASEAAGRVGAVARRGGEAGVKRFYKKTDSTLRGNVGAELEALLRAVGGGRLAFVPAYPKTGRTTRGGRQYVNGVALEESSFANDPLEPATQSRIATIISRQSAAPVVSVSLRDDDAAKAWRSVSEGIGVFDCESDEELREIGEFLAAEDALGLLGGPAGLAELLPDLLSLPRTPVAVRAHRGPLLAVCGSANEVSRRQVEYALEHGFEEVSLAGGLVDGFDDGEGRALVLEAARAAGEGENVVIRTDVTDDAGGALAAMAGISHFAASAMRDGCFRGVVVFGGDTAIAVMKAAGCSGTVPTAEIVPGVVLSELAGMEGGPAFVTKAGGFGAEDVLVEIAGYFG